MRQRIIPFIPIAFGLFLAVGGLTVLNNGAGAADDCLEKPDYQQGGHWRYRTDRSTNRKCWYLRSDDGETARGTQGTQDTADEDTEEGTTPVVQQTTPRPVQRSARPLALPNSPSTRSRPPEQQTAPTPPAPAAPLSTATNSRVPSNPPTSSWPWPNDSTPAQTQPSTNYDAPKPVTPVKVQIVQQASQATREQAPPAPALQAPASQALAEQAAVQQTSDVEDSEKRPLGGSALDMLQTAFQRMTAPATPGGEPDHTLALLATAFAFITIGCGIVVATIWSMPSKKPDQSSGTWDKVYREPTAEVVKQTYQEAYQEPYRESYQEQEPRAASYAGAGIDTYHRRPRDVPNFAELARSVRAVYEERESAGQDPRYQEPAYQQPVHQQPRHQEAHYQEPAFQEPQTYQQRLPAPLAPDAPPAAVQAFEPQASRRRPVSERAVQNTLRQLLHELEVKMHRREAPAESVEPADVAHDLAPSQGPGRSSRGRFRRA
jgi:hypothetical protein